MKKLVIVAMIGLICPQCYASNYNSQIPLPGYTMANTNLQYDTLLPVYMAIGTKLKGCENMSVNNTKVTKQPYNLKSQNGQYIAGQWEEIWTVNACNKEVDVPIKFMLDETGATYMISPNNIYVK